mgnify:CR=1 FL=1
MGFLVFCSYSKADVCPTDVVGLCNPQVIIDITEIVVIETTNDGSGITTITTTTTDTETTTISNEDSDNILDAGNGYVSAFKEGDMDVDWGGEGPASMPTTTCGSNLGTDKCAEITGSGDNISVNGVSGMGTTFAQSINIENINVDNGGRVTYTIKVDKQDSSDSIYLHITGKNGKSTSFSETDLLSASGVNSGYSEYTGGFDYGSSLTSLIVEIGGRNINLSVGPMFDDVTINVLYNVINTIITQSITTLEVFIALNIGVDDIVIDLAKDIFDNTTVEAVEGIVEIKPMEGPQDVTYEMVEVEMSAPVGELAPVVKKIETKVDTVEVKTVEQAVVEEIKQAPVKTQETKEAKKETTPTKVEIKKQKQEAGSKIVAKMGDKARYDSSNQMKTLIVMSVLADTKTFFDSKKMLVDTVDLFSDTFIPDSELSDNNLASYVMSVGSDQAMDALIQLQYR